MALAAAGKDFGGCLGPARLGAFLGPYQHGLFQPPAVFVKAKLFAGPFNSLGAHGNAESHGLALEHQGTDAAFQVSVAADAASQTVHC